MMADRIYVGVATGSIIVGASIVLLSGTLASAPVFAAVGFDCGLITISLLNAFFAVGFLGEL